MKKAILSLGAVIFLGQAAMLAQSKGPSSGLAFRYTWSNFQFPITEKLKQDDYTSGAELAYTRQIGRRLNLAIPLKMAKAELPINETEVTKNAELIGSLDAILQLKLAKAEAKIWPYVLAGAGIMTESNWEINPEFPVGLGLNIRLTQNLYLSGESQFRYDLNENRNSLQHALGIWINLGDEPEQEPVADADKDGIPDKEDSCPNEPGPATTFGCPDSDADGIANKNDSCPDQAGPTTFSGCPDSDGDGVPDHQDRCPKEAGTLANGGCPVLDTDGDGIPDTTDKCPNQKGTNSNGGCPDTDGDGVADDDDRCPSEAGPVSGSGCPDTDGDGVIDIEDRCPTTAGPVSNKGCPDLKPEEKKVLEFAMKAVQFETGSSRLLASSNKVLDEIVAILKNYPEQKLRISGHTDSIGEAPENLALSEKRAKACRDYLVAKGIDAKRVTHSGFGESKPIGDNRFAPGREQNRRVEFEIYVD